MGVDGGHMQVTCNDLTVLISDHATRIRVIGSQPLNDLTVDHRAATKANEV